ncbi:hypothetical protein DPEC_G00305890 [Dallia pectoralis]|uniref:Uncharacterized protein n=1 Tax=Dallia pectoralis TaxID=75939 RepID=A0ACC2FE32_DALPE|nr:hypothetical protein DPEC_G00305890 [Dallia pectoralis]
MPVPPSQPLYFLSVTRRVAAPRAPMTERHDAAGNGVWSRSRMKVHLTGISLSPWAGDGRTPRLEDVSSWFASTICSVQKACSTGGMRQSAR